jgi:hypothetical protein
MRLYSIDMATQATEDESEDSVDYQAVAVARVRDAVDEIDTSHRVDIGSFEVYDQSSEGEIVVAAQSESGICFRNGDVFGMEQAKARIINKVMKSDASVRLRSYNADNGHVTFEAETPTEGDR